MILRVGKLFFIGALAVLFSRAAYSQATMGSLDQNADQSQGQYMPMNLGYAGFNSLGMTQAAWLDPLQNLGEGQSKPAYSKYYWSPDLILPIRLREGMITLLNFPQWELIEDMYIGDNATFDGQISGPNTILLYPRKGANVGVDTNIIIFGRSGNKYVFYVRSEGVNTERLTNSIIDIDVIDGPAGSRGAGMVGGSVGGGSGMNASSYKAGNSHSADSLFTKRFQRSDWIKEIPLDPTKFRFDIEVYVPNPDDVVIAPERVWRDDIFTYIDLGEKALNMTQRPIVTLIVERIEVPVGFRTKGPNNRLIIVEGIGDMVLRNGKRIVCLKMRRSDDAGLENATYATDFDDSAWDVPPAMPGQQARNGQVSGGSGSDSEFNGGGAAGGGMPGQYDIQVGQSEIVVPHYGNGGGGNVNVNYHGPMTDLIIRKCSIFATIINMPAAELERPAAILVSVRGLPIRTAPIFPSNSEPTPMSAIWKRFGASCRKNILMSSAAMNLSSRLTRRQMGREKNCSTSGSVRSKVWKRATMYAAALDVTVYFVV